MRGVAETGERCFTHIGCRLGNVLNRVTTIQFLLVPSVLTLCLFLGCADSVPPQNSTSFTAADPQIQHTKPLSSNPTQVRTSTPDNRESALVTRVIDGDTVYGLLDGKTYKIRLSEIDAPERSQPFGRQSKVYLRNLLEKGVFDAHINQQDQYGRYLAKIYSNGIDINRAMVAGGMAWVYDLYVCLLYTSPSPRDRG